MAVQLLLSLGYVGYAGNSTDVRHGQLIAPFLLMLAAAGLVWLWRRMDRVFPWPAVSLIAIGRKREGEAVENYAAAAR